MAFLGRVIRFLFWVVVLTWGLSLLRRFLRAVGSGPARRARDIDVPNDAVTQKLVRDPVCGMHIAPSLALIEKNGRETLYFCSAECHDKYLSDTKRFAANA